jgi:hypothetical protein
MVQIQIVFKTIQTHKDRLSYSPQVIIDGVNGFGLCLKTFIKKKNKEKKITFTRKQIEQLML